MPRSTLEFPFEDQILHFACDHSNHRAGATKPFLLLVDHQGNAISTKFRSRDESTQHVSNCQALLVDARVPDGGLFFDPFDFPEYAWLAWNNIDRPAMERTIGAVFEESAFRSASGETIAFPARWSVMV